MRPKNPTRHPLEIALIDGEVVFLGEGAVNFSMTVEAARATLQRLADTLLTLGPLERARANASTPVVLLVEDEPLIRELGVLTLQDAGYVVIEAEDAADALMALEACAQIHLMITDIQIPGELDGLALARLVSDRWPKVGLLVASGRIRPRPEDLPSKGRFMAKPYAMTDLLRQVNELIAA
jgi:CheY-like chemotaxis protein